LFAIFARPEAVGNIFLNQGINYSDALKLKLDADNPEISLENDVVYNKGKLLVSINPRLQHFLASSYVLANATPFEP